MAIHSASELIVHRGHALNVLTFHDGHLIQDVAIECLDCNTVLVTFPATADELVYVGEHDDCPIEVSHAHAR